MQLQGPVRKKNAKPAPAAKTSRTDDHSAPIRCLACAHVITHTSSKREAGGRHVHLRLNPAAFAFVFGCFSTAPGCLVQGTATLEATWFPGCRWQYAHCGNCLTHLGWSFSGADTFFALLLEQLVDETS